MDQLGKKSFRLTLKIVNIQAMGRLLVKEKRIRIEISSFY